MSKNNNHTLFDDIDTVRANLPCGTLGFSCPLAQVYTHMQHMIHGLMISNAALARAAAPQLDNIAIIVAQGKQLDALQDEFANAHSFHYITAMENKALRLENQRLTRALNGLTTGNQAYVYALGQNTLRNL